VLEDRNLLSPYVVDHLADDLVGSGLSGSLRYCLANASEGDAITFGVQGTITLSSGQLVVTKGLDIEGPGADQLTISGNNAARVFQINAGLTAGISDVTIADGAVNGVLVEGGGIYNLGTLALSNCILSGNSTGFDGGAIGNGGTLTVSNSTLSGNSAQRFGGGIANIEGSGSMLTVSNSTLSGNFAVQGSCISNRGSLTTVSNSTLSGNVAGQSGVNGAGGGIENFGTLVVSDSTLSGNSAGLTGGGIWNGGGTLTMNNSVVAGNSSGFGPDIAGAVAASSSYNLIGNGSALTGISNGVNGNQVGSASNPIDPKLGPLQDNGGPTETRELLAGSPALNAGDANELGVADQRGVARAGGVNIGAYQASASAFVLSGLPSAAEAGTALDLTVQAVDPFGQTAFGYTGTAQFSSTDGGATLPDPYPFTAGDNGTHTFGGGVTLVTSGDQAVTATDAADNSITGGATVTVSPAAADHLVFLQQPSDTGAGQTITPAVMVAVVDRFGNVVTGDNADTVTLALGTNPGGGTLSGALIVTVTNGVATFADLSIDQAGDGYTLNATVAGLTAADSAAFRITA
jgi:hypothetical protein